MEFLHELWRRARRPPMREISRVISDADYLGTASTETIRKMLRGTAVPTQWRTAEAVMLALCELGGVDPGDEWEHLGEDGTPRSHLERLWHRALDQPNAVYSRSHWGDDPWGSDGSDPF